MIPTPGSIEEHIYLAVAETVENLAFEEAVLEGITPYEPPMVDLESLEALTLFERVVQEKTLDAQEPYWAFMSVLDPRIGDFAFWLSRNLATRFAEAIHSIPAEEIASELVFDNMGELLNTLSGRLMAHVLPPERGFMLDLPRTGRGHVPILPMKSRLLKFLVGAEYFVLVVPDSYWKLFEDCRRPPG